MVWGKAGSITLTSAEDTLTTDTFTSSKFNQFMFHETGGNGLTLIQIGNSTIDTGNNYSLRWQENGSGDQTTINTNQLGQVEMATGTGVIFTVGYIINISSEEKLSMHWNTGEYGTGASVVPKRTESVAKWTDTSNQFDIIRTYTTTSDGFAIDSNLTILGSDLTPAAAVDVKIQNGAVFEETDTNKHYLLDDGTWTEI